MKEIFTQADDGGGFAQVIEAPPQAASTDTTLPRQKADGSPAGDTNNLNIQREYSAENIEGAIVGTLIHPVCLCPQFQHLRSQSGVQKSAQTYGQTSAPQSSCFAVSVVVCSHYQDCRWHRTSAYHSRVRSLGCAGRTPMTMTASSLGSFTRIGTGWLMSTQARPG